MPRQKQSAPERRTEESRAAASWTDRDLLLENVATQAAAADGAARPTPPGTSADQAGPAAAGGPPVVEIDSGASSPYVDPYGDLSDLSSLPASDGGEVIAISDGDDVITLSDGPEPAAAARRRRPARKRASDGRGDEAYERVAAELAQFEFYVPVVAGREREDGDPVVGTLELKLADDAERPEALPDGEKFWVYVGEERTVLYFEWLAKTASGKRRVERTQCLPAAVVADMETWRLLSGAAGGVETVLRQYSSVSGRLVLDLLLAEKAFVTLPHPSQVPRRLNASCRALLRRLLQLPGQELEFRPLGPLDVDALYRRLAERRQENPGWSRDLKSDGDPGDPGPDPQHPQLLPPLRQYQRAAVRWMFSRERPAPCDPSQLHPLYVPLPLGGATVYYCPLGGWALRDRPAAVSSPPGGILADEMGLGKTVEILSLVLIHPRPDAEVPEELEPVDLAAWEALQKAEERRKKRPWSGSEDEDEGNKRRGRRRAVRLNSGSDSDGEEYVKPTMSRAERLQRRSSHVETESETGSSFSGFAAPTELAVDGLKRSLKRGRCPRERTESPTNKPEPCWETGKPMNNGVDQCEEDENAIQDTKPPKLQAVQAIDNIKPSGPEPMQEDVKNTGEDTKPSFVNSSPLPEDAEVSPENSRPCSGIRPDDTIENCIEDVIVRVCYGGLVPKDYIRGLGVIPGWEQFYGGRMRKGCSTGSVTSSETSGASTPVSARKKPSPVVKPDMSDSVNQAIEAVVVRVCYDDRPPPSYRPGIGMVRKKPVRRSLSDSRRLAQLHYDEALGRMASGRSRPAAEEVDPSFSCLCGKWKDQRYRVQCGDCGTFQHARCVGYDVEDRLRGPYFCPQCWTRQPPVRSGATLIVSPAAISDQWVQEIQKHIAKEGLRVLVYTGVRSDRYMQPRTLAAHDLVVTTYTVLQRELNYTGVGRGDGGEAGQRRAQRYLPPPTPLLCVQWWRVCLDEAQMVESPTSRTAEMALKLSCVHRWCVTGTPLSRSVGDLYGLLLFLGVDPVWSELWWNQLVYYPYLHGDAAPLERLMDRVLWRTAKADVLDQMGIPGQREELSRLDFSPVESYFYRRQHEECARDARAALARLRAHGVDSVLLRDLERSAVNQLLRPLLRLRQACCHPQVVRGQFMPLTKSTLTMEQLVEQLIRRASAEAEEAHRQRNAAQHGLAALHVVRAEWPEAAELYRAVLRQADELRGRLQTDMLQRLHALHNLSELIAAGRPVPPTTRDHRLAEEAAELRAAYVGRHSAHVAQARAAAAEISSEADGHAARLDAAARPWFVVVLLRWAEAVGPREVVDRVTQQLRDLSSADANAEKQADTGITKRTKVLKVRPPANTMLDRFASVPGLQRLLTERLATLAELRQLAQDELGALVELQPGQLVSAAVDCHLRPSGAAADRCRLCCVSDTYERYERELFYMKRGRVEGSELSGVEGKISVLGELQRGSWADNETERVLKCLLGAARQLGLEQALTQLGTHHLKMLAAMKKEFRSLRVLWTRVNDRVSASDELEMAVLRLRTRYEDEPAPDLPVAQGGQTLPTYVIEPHQVDEHRGRLVAERAVAESELRRKLGQRLYLQNLQRSGTDYRDGNPDPCPICETELGRRWSVLQCGHCFCMTCVTRLVEEFSLAGRRGRVKCAICRQVTRHADIAYVNAGAAAEEDEAAVTVKGSHSTKVEAVVRCVLTILAREPAAKALVFATWTDALDLISAALAQNDVSHRSLHAPGKFQRHLREFRALPDVSVLLLPVHSGANGLNLTEATHVVLTHPVLDPGAERQAVGRVHRIGQQRATVVHRLVVRDTIEERVLALNASRPAANPAAKADGELGMSLAELRALFVDEPDGAEA